VDDDEYEDMEDDLLEADPVRWDKSIAVSDFMQMAANMAAIHAAYMRVVANRLACDAQYEFDMSTFLDAARSEIESVPTTEDTN
jgi:hypothetical protein